MYKPMLADDYVESKLRFPLGAQPKIDGVRALNMDGRLLGRSGKAHANKYTTDFYSRPEYIGFDGELAAEHECHPDLCRLTTSAVSTITGEPYTLWHLFDYVTSDTIHLSYKTRYEILYSRVSELRACGHTNLVLVPMHICHDLKQLNDWDNSWLELGYEGTIIRDLQGKHKQGRSTPNQMGLLRIKRFIEEDARVIKVVEGMHNANEAMRDPHGYIERSSHQENMIPNGMVGSMECEALKNVFAPWDSSLLLIKEGQIITVSPGCMTHDMRLYYFAHQNELIGQIVKYKFFPKGIKDKPRFPTYQSHRASSDMD